ncbi:DEAD-box ATP-dependent RNA helicase [Chloropicon primus]|uniref:DEAD-box ATP-dependent RNA helicase n=1 Tax=Chloropicon primus TaxID=1764295 RepID=A0A5B8N009_9CHLO|nr:DEAD-box ATP-dependent RNA helicase [Chloropicon primus]UPR04498.1 DEAD-box ATP-dependent RNA helicase [Chloropicon primus]|mmetsp:Transcript_5111/g.15366  ORF Transcript_5111/g.15366 Transcript_5111/m.15366 type:complete len:471 (+) Transcript_5111:191-1603(+)|eukprot:QDZ25292.1 DEAD-box ATP-dependent RNA helicase [Chloropicon primus]
MASGAGLGEVGLRPELVRALERLGIERLLPIQEKALRALAGGERRHFDMRICSPTGSGKTLAYALPIVQECLRCQEESQLQCITILPTRDLAMQVHSVFTSLVEGCREGESSPVSVGLCCGLASLDEESEQFLSKRERIHGAELVLAPNGLRGTRSGGGVSVLVATPGRLKSHLERKSLHLSGLKFLVLDEMDRLLQQSYNDCIPFLLQQYEECKTREKEAEVEGMFGGSFGGGGNRNRADRENLFLSPQYNCLESRLVRLSVSATIGGSSNKMAKIRETFVRTISAFDAPEDGQPGSKYELPEQLEDFRVICSKEKKPFAFLDLLNKIDKQRAICFTNSTEASHLITTLIRKKGSGDWRCEAYNSKRSPNERFEALEKFKKGEIDLLVASDALSRGIDLPDVKLVINYDMPSSTKNYVHRVGRTARVGERGMAVTILQKEDVVHFKRLIKKVGDKRWGKMQVMSLRELS